VYLLSLKRHVGAELEKVSELRNVQSSASVDQHFHDDELTLTAIRAVQQTMQSACWNFPLTFVIIQ
jgi:hypothetical protein